MKSAIFFLLLSVLLNQEGYAQVPSSLTLEDAQQISDAAEQKARENNWNVVIAVLDGGDISLPYGGWMAHR